MKIELSDATREVIERERLLISDLRALLGRLNADDADLTELKNALRDLEGIFMLVVCGEYNSGKSTLLNAMLNAKVLPEGVTPTTDRITIVTQGTRQKDVEETGELVRREHPAAILQDLALVDTPGTNAIIQRHQALTERFIPRADLVLFVTSADHPFTETERRFLDLISSWGKKIVIVVNKLDILDDESEREDVIGFVRDHALETLGIAPEIFPVRAKAAFRNRQKGESDGDTGVPELERYIAAKLATLERVRLKLKNPLGVARHIADRYREVVKQRLKLLEDDKRTLEEVNRQVRQFERDMKREFETYLARVKTVLLEVERRGEVFFDDFIRFRRVLDLINTERVQEAFQHRVIRSADRDIDAAVNEMVDWFLQRNLQLWEDVMTFVQERRQATEERVIGEIGGRFHYDRENLIRTLGHSAEEAMETYDREGESRRLAESLQGAVVQSGLLQVGGLGIGAAIVALLHGIALDVTGIMAGLTIAGFGLLVLPRRRRQAKRELHDKMQALRDGLSESIGKQFDRELARALEKLEGAISPYTRFVRSELDRLESLQVELEGTTDRLIAVAGEVDALERLNED